jgi:hypothetical protein
MPFSRYLTSARALVLFMLAGAVGCKYDSPYVTPSRVLTTIGVTVPSASLELGQTTVATAQGFDQDGAPIEIGAVAWSTGDQTVAPIGPTGLIFGVAPGTTEITATVNGRTGRKIISVKKSAGIRVNEIAPHNSAGAGFIELLNPTDDAVDLSSWTITDRNVFVSFTFPAGTVIAAGGFLVLDEANLPFTVDANDDAHLFSKFGVQVDAATWAIDSAGAFGRCSDGSDSFVVLASRTKGAANACPAALAPSVADQLGHLRAATARFQTFAAADSAGYSAQITGCMTDPKLGGMGFHFGKPAAIDDKANPLEPEVLLYEPQKNGRPRLVAVEFIIPYSLRPRNGPAPTLFGQPFLRNDGFELWGLHAWIWRNNPAGMFADWNPDVNCDAVPAAARMSHSSP